MSDILLHHSAISTTYHLNINLEKGAGGRVRVKIPRDKLTAYHWIESHFHDCIDFYCVVFSAIFNRVTRMGLHVCEFFRRKKIMASKDS